MAGALAVSLLPAHCTLSVPVPCNRVYWGYPYMVALVLTTGLSVETIEGLVRVRVTEFEPFFHCKLSIFGYVCTPPGRVMFPPDACAVTPCIVSTKTLLGPFPLAK